MSRTSSRKRIASALSRFPGRRHRSGLPGRYPRRRSTRLGPSPPRASGGTPDTPIHRRYGPGHPQRAGIPGARRHRAAPGWPPAKASAAADRVLQLNPNNLRALYVEALNRKGAADPITDAAAKQAALDAAAGFAQRGLTAPKAASMSDADFKTLQTALYPSFYSVIGFDAFLKKGRAATMTHDYKRNGTTALFAALNVLDGQVIAQCQQRHRHTEWLKFLRQIERETPKGKTLNLIADNY